MATGQEQSSTPESELQNESAVKYFEGLIGRTLHVSIEDGRTFVGGLKCTDRDCNLILENSQEYRFSTGDNEAAEPKSASSETSEKEVHDAPSRFVGLIVIPGEYIRVIELEEFDVSAMAQ